MVVSEVLNFEIALTGVRSNREVSLERQDLQRKTQETRGRRCETAQTSLLQEDGAQCLAQQWWGPYFILPKARANFKVCK